MKYHMEKPGIFCCYTTAETSTAFLCVSTSSQLGQAMLLELLCQCLSEQTATANASTPKRLDIQKHPNIAIFWKELHVPKLVGITVSMFNDCNLLKCQWLDHPLPSAHWVLFFGHARTKFLRKRACNAFTPAWCDVTVLSVTPATLLGRVSTSQQGILERCHFIILSKSVAVLQQNSWMIETWATCSTS